jgi:hypothetical protein
MINLWRSLNCWMGWCPGGVVSGWRDGRVCVGWRCQTCGKVKHYGPAHGI